MPYSQHETESPTACGGLVPSETILPDVLEKPLIDCRKYRLIRLDNDLEVLLVHGSDTDKASAALDVNVGSFSDDSDLPGEAHAVEHMLFMGSKKFPEENDYAQYVLNHSGLYNADTKDTSTNFHFNINAKPANDQNPCDSNPSPLRGALDRFAQFFRKPLFLSSTLQRELKNVDSEHNNYLQDDYWRLDQLQRFLSNPNHPYSKFGTGNLDVLQTLPEARDINVRDRLMEFYAKHYSANRMKLVVLGRESLDVLQKWVVELFTPITNKKLTPNRWTDDVPFPQSSLGTQCFAEPVKDIRDIYLHFPFPDEESMYKCPPSRYISHLIGHEGPGSVFFYIKAKGWVTEISAQVLPVCPGTPAIFEVKFSLTKEGMESRDRIVEIFFQYISLLREDSPQEWIFEELKTMGDIEFRFDEKTPDIDFTGSISSAMQKPLPHKWLLSGDKCLWNFEPQQIKDALSALRPNNLRMTIVSRDLPGELNQTEEWYGTKHRCEKIPDSLMESFEHAYLVTPEKRLSTLHPPHPNTFIPRDLNVQNKEVKTPLEPLLIRNDDRARTWWMEEHLGVPKANIVVGLRTPLVNSSAKNQVKARLISNLLYDEFEQNPSSYNAKLAGLWYNVYPDGRGLVLSFAGYNNHLPVFLEMVVKTMKDLDIKDDRFDIIKEQLTKRYDNFQLEKPYKQVQRYAGWLIAESNVYTVEHLAAELPKIAVGDVRLFQQEMLARIFIEVYVNGNILQKVAFELTEKVEGILNPGILPRDQWPIIRSLILPSGSDYVYIKTLKDPDNTNHCIEVWFYIGDRGDRGVRAKTFLIEQMMKEPAFDQLRTKENLGYVIWTYARDLSTAFGLRLLLQSEMTPEYLDSRIQAFLTKFGGVLQKMTDEEFGKHKQSAVNLRLAEEKTLDQELTQQWYQIEGETYDFECDSKDAAHIKPLTKSEMMEFFDRHFNPSSNHRACLSVYLRAQRQAEEVRRRQEEARDQLPQTETTGAAEITDVRLFKSSLPASSGGHGIRDLIVFKDPKANIRERTSTGIMGC